MREGNKFNGNFIIDFCIKIATHWFSEAIYFHITFEGFDIFISFINLHLCAWKYRFLKLFFNCISRHLVPKSKYRVTKTLTLYLFSSFETAVYFFFISDFLQLTFRKRMILVVEAHLCILQLKTKF